MLAAKDFLFIVEHTPLVSIDLMVRRPDGSLLLGYRLNEPARHTWFVPGGRILKNETLPQAFTRIVSSELAIDVAFESARLRGAFTHLYDTNFQQAADIGTHYVVLAYEFACDVDLEQLPEAQHSRYRWWSASQAKASDEVHRHSLAYFLLDDRQ